MSKAKTLIQTHAQDLNRQKQEASWWRWCYWLSLLALPIAATLWLWFGLWIEVANVGYLGAIVALFLAMRKGDEFRDLEAERLEFERPEFYGFDLTQSEEEADRDDARLGILGREIVSRKRMRLLRQRARYAETSGIIIGSVALTLLIWFGFSVEDFLREYHAEASRYSDQELWEYELEVISIGLVGFLFGGWTLTRFRSARSARREIERVEIEHEIMPVEDQPDAARARKLLLANQRSLGSYYAINRFNSRVSMAIAVFCVLAGIAITVWTIREVASEDTAEGSSKLVIAAIGAVNAIMINFVAAIVLRMQATISSNVNAFHERLVGSNDIFLANVIAAEIEDERARRDTLAAISKAIGLRGTPSAKDAASG